MSKRGFIITSFRITFQYHSSLVINVFIFFILLKELRVKTISGFKSWMQELFCRRYNDQAIIIIIRKFHRFYN